MLEEYDYVLKNVEMINEEKYTLISELKGLGIEVIESDSNTIMSKTTFDEEVIENLFLNNVSVITLYDESNKIHFRIAVQDRKSNEMFIKRLKEVLNK